MSSSKNDYSKSLNRMRANYQRQGNPLINTEDDNGNVGNELSAFAYMDTETPAPEQASTQKDTSFFGKLFGDIDEIASKFGAGYVGAWEGGLDLIANFIGALGDWTGGWDSKIFTDWAKQDIGTASAEWVKTYANFTPWGLYDRWANGHNLFNEEWRSDMLNSAGDILGSAFFAQNTLEDHRKDADKNYTYDDNLETGFGQFLGEGAHTIGFMLPSIQTAGASGLGTTGAKILATGMMGVSAGGKGSEEALNEGANATQALGYGTLTGAIEAGTEWIPFPGGNAVGGVIGKKTSGNIVKRLAKEMFEEGIEEVVSEGLNPLVKAITYDKSAINDYTKGEYYLDVLKAFGSGAIMGGVFSGVHTATMRHNLSANGVTVAEGMQNISEEIEKANKNVKKGKITQEQYEQRINELAKEANNLRTIYEKMPQKYKDNFMKMLNDPKEFKKDLKQYEKKNNVKFTKEEVETYSKEVSNRLAKQYFDYFAEDLPNELKKVTISKQFANNVLNKSNSQEIQDFLNNTFNANIDDNYVVKNLNNSNEKLVVQPFSENGKIKYGYITIDSNTNQIIDVDIRNNEIKDRLRYSIVPKDDVTKVRDTKLKNKDGSARRYKFADNELNMYGYAMTPITDLSEASLFIYSKKPLRVKNYAKDLAFEKMSKKFNIPASLEKTYSKKLSSNNPFDVIEFISRYAKTDVKGVLNQLGYDAVELKDGDVVSLNASNIIKGDLKYGEEKGNYGYSDLVKWYGRESANEQLQKFIGKNGSELETREQRKEYAKLILDNHAYSSEHIADKEFAVIDKAVYHKELKSIENNNSKIGAKTKFIIDKNNELPRASGFYDGYGTIYLIVGNEEARSLTERSEHEVVHYLDDVYHLSMISDVYDYFDEWAEKYPEEYNKIFKDYELAYRGLYDNWNLKEKIDNELLAEIYSLQINLEDAKIQGNIIKTIDKVRKLTKSEAEKMTVKSIDDDFEPISVKHKTNEDISYTVTKTKKNSIVDITEEKTKSSTVGLAVSYDTDISIDDFDKKIETYKPYAVKSAEKLSKLFGVKISVGSAIGGWTYTDNANVSHIGGEPSFPLTIEGFKSIDDVKLIASIMADTAYEAQNSVGIFEYSKDGKSDEITLQLTKVDEGLLEIIKNVGFDGYTINKLEKNIVIVGAPNSKIDTLLGEAIKGGYIDVEQEHQRAKCNDYWLDANARRDIYKTWLETKDSGENRSLSNLVSKAEKISGYISEHLDKDGYRIKGTLSKSSDILKTFNSGVSENRPTYREIVKNNANLKHAKVYNLKTINQIVDNALTNMLDKWDNAIKISIPTGKRNLVNWTFEEINLAKDLNVAVENIVDTIEKSVVTFDNGKNGQQKIVLKNLNMREDLTKAIRGLLQHKGELSTKSKWWQHYIDTLHRYANYVHEQALLRSEYVTAVKAQKTLDGIFKDTRSIKIGGDTIVNEITLYKQLTSNLLLSKSSKNVAPSSFTKLVNNFNNYTANNYNAYYDATLRDLVDELALSFENGAFPNREPTLREMQLFNAIRSRIITRCNELMSEKRQAKKLKNEWGTISASISLKAVEPKRYGKVNNIADNALSLPVKLRSALGTAHPFVQLLTEEYMKVYSNAQLKINEFKNYTFEELAKQAGYKKRGELLKELKQKVAEIKDRNGDTHKITVDDIVGAYWTYKTAKEQLLATGLTLYSQKNKTNIDFKLTDTDYQDMFSKLPVNAQAWADLVFEKYFNGVDYDYKTEIIKQFFGDINFLDARKGTYAPTSRVGQVNMGVGASSEFDAGYLSTMLKGFLKERVKNKNHFRWVNASNVLENNINQVANWGEKSQWVDDVRTALNTTIPGVGNHTLEYYLQEHFPEWKTVWSPLMTKIILGKQILEKKHGLLETLGNIGQISTLGLNVGSVLRQTLSDFAWTFDDRVSWRLWVRTIPEAVNNFFRAGQIRKELMENNGYFIERFNEGEVIKAIMNGNLPSRIGQVVLKPMEWLDSVVVTTHGYALAKRIVNAGIQNGTYSFAKNSPEYKREVAHVLQGMVLISQSNADPMFTSRLRSGDAGWINREVFGRFASDNQNKIQALHQITIEKINSEKRRKAYLEASNDTTKYTDAQRDEFKKLAEKETLDFKKNYGKKVAGFLVSMILQGFGAYFISQFVKKLKGKKEWDENENPEEMLKNVFLESTVNWIPYIGTIANAIENNSDVSAFTVEKLNNIIDMAKLVDSAFKTRNEVSIRKAIWSLITNGLELTGIPANNIYQLFMGIWYQFDKEGSLSAQSWVKGYNASYMKSQYTDAVNKGNNERAIAQLGAWSSMYSTNITDKATLEELTRLSMAGYNATPSSNMTSYTNETGDKIAFTSAQANTFKEEYAKSNKSVSELLKIEDYKKQDDKAKTSMISKIYKTYHDCAQAKALGVVPNSKLAQLIYYSNGDVDLAKYIMSMQTLSAVTEDKKNTRKENVVATINKMKGFTRQEKLLLAYLSGYSVNDQNKTALSMYLYKLGFSKKNVKTYLGLDKK